MSLFLNTILFLLRCFHLNDNLILKIFINFFSNNYVNILLKNIIINNTSYLNTGEIYYSLTKKENDTLWDTTRAYLSSLTLDCNLYS
ncbi:MAG: hypothetical protein BAJALOKI1v1_510013 [Promethearchaeota archaeon]|nr:MAG: hypothetical protein BAJALOKI1v1_510013 [Candidatus Lokiarchaeota archaeon]